MVPDLPFRVKQFMDRQGLIAPGDTVIVGLSGGADSVALLCILDKWRGRVPFDLKAVHVNHGIRQEGAFRDQVFSETLCRQKGLTCEVVSVDVPAYARVHGLGTEEAGRKLRHAALEKVASAYRSPKIALGHHQNDNEETIFLNFIRGSGLRGLGGILPMQGIVIHPLLEVPKKDIVAYLQSMQQEWVEDETNLDLQYTRNFLRKRLLPEIHDGLQPALSDRLTNQARFFRDVDNYMTEEAKAWYGAHVEEEQRAVFATTKSLKALHRALRLYVLYAMITQMAGMSQNIGMVHVEGVNTLVEQMHARHWDLPYGLYAQKENGNIWIKRKEEHNGGKDTGVAE